MPRRRSARTTSRRRRGLDQFREMLGRQVDFERIGRRRRRAYPMLLLGAVDVLSGRFRAFNSRRERITADAVLASAAIPTLFRAVHPTAAPTGTGCSRRTRRSASCSTTEPDEIWVIQINPTERDDEPRTRGRDRRPAQRAGRQPVAVPGAALHREDRPAAGGGRCSRRRPVQADDRADHRAVPARARRPGSVRPPSSTATRRSSAS